MAGNMCQVVTHELTGIQDAILPCKIYKKTVSLQYACSESVGGACVSVA